MAMIGVSSTLSQEPKTVPNEPEPKTEARSSRSSLSEPETQVVDGLSIPLNPWGGPLLGQPDSIGGSSLLQPTEPVKGWDLQARLREADLEQKAREAELERRRLEEEEARKRQAELLQQQQQQEAEAQRQQAGVQNQVELGLMERISNIVENSWGQSDLVSVLSTLHTEDSKVIPLLNS